MFYNYLKIALRSLIRNKVSSFVNISGLAVGMAVAMLIGLWIYDELSFNKYHQNYDRIAQVMRQMTRNGERATSPYHPMPLGAELREVYGSNFKYLVMVRQTENHIISAGNKKFTQTGNYMEAEGPEMLTLKMLQGTRSGLRNLHSILLSESLAKKLFGAADPINQFVKIDNKSDVLVTGVYADLPHNSQFKDATFLAPLDLLGNDPNEWDNFNILLYAQLADHADFRKATAAIKDAYLSHVDKEKLAAKPALMLYPMRNWHLYSDFENGVPVTSKQMKFIIFYGIIGIFVLLLACINFMNLSTARSQKRAKEVGIRKTMGSARPQLVGQFLSESLVVATFAFGLSVFLVQLALPWFNSVADKQIAPVWATPGFWVAGATFTIITGLLAGSYPAIYLSSFNPVKALKGSSGAGYLVALPRKVLVVVQFTVSITLIIGTLIVYRQIQFTKDRPVGYSQEGLRTLQMTSPDFYDKYDLLRNELKNTGVVYEIAQSGSPLTGISSMNRGFTWKGKDPNLEATFNTLPVTPEYGKAIGWQFKEGRDFAKEFASDSSGFVVNRAAVKLMGLKNPVGEIIRWETDWRGNGSFKIIGVVEDMVMESPFEPVKPTIFFLGGGMNWIFVKINPQVSVRKALPKIEAVFKKVIPSAPFNYKFVDDEYAAKFKAEEQIGTLAGGFASLAIIISCLGLFGLVSFTAEQRTKEIGIRKVLGASVINLVSLLSKDFLKLVLLANILAWPLAYWGMHHWLQNYSFRIPVSAWLFVGPALLVLVIALLTVSFQAIKAALANPVEALRTE